jgi:hypothetical protein
MPTLERWQMAGRKHMTGKARGYSTARSVLGRSKEGSPLTTSDGIDYRKGYIVVLSSTIIDTPKFCFVIYGNPSLGELRERMRKRGIPGTEHYIVERAGQIVFKK